MASITFAQSVSGVGGTNSANITRSASAGINYEETLVAGTAGTLSTRASDTAGTATVLTGHAIVTGDKIDIHWTSGGINYVAYGATAGTVAAAPSDTSIPFTGATGDVLPTQDDAIVVSEQLSVNTNIDGDELALLSIQASTTTNTLRNGVHIQFNDVGAAEISDIDLITNEPQTWDVEGGSANPFTGNPITNAKMSTGTRNSFPKAV